MDKITLNYHLKLQEMCDCYMETDYLPEMQDMAAEKISDLEEDALKYLALSVLHAITEEAGELSFKKKGEEITVKVKGNRKEVLPTPPMAIFEKIIEIMRTILHLEEDNGKIPFSLGLRTGEITLDVRIKQKKNSESLKFKFPE